MKNCEGASEKSGASAVKGSDAYETEGPMKASWLSEN